MTNLLKFVKTISENGKYAVKGYYNRISGLIFKREDGKIFTFRRD